MPTTHTWKTGASGFLYDPTEYLDGASFVPGDTVVFSSGTPNAGNGNLNSGTYIANTTGPSIGLDFVNITAVPGTTIDVVGPLTLQWLAFGTFVNDGALAFGTTSSPGSVHYNLFDEGTTGGSFTNAGTMTLQGLTAFDFDQGSSSNGNFVNSAGALLSIDTGSAFYGPGSINSNAHPIFENDGRVEVNGTVGYVTNFKPPGTYQGSGVLVVQGAPGNAQTSTVATFSGNARGRMDLTNGELVFNSDYNAGPNVSINFLDAHGLVLDNESEVGGSISTVQTGHPLQGTISGFVAGDAIQFQMFYPFTGTRPPVLSSYDPAAYLLTLTLNAGQVSYLTFNGNYSLSDFHVAVTGDQTITLTTTSTANALTVAPPQTVTATPGNDNFTDTDGNQLYIGDGGHDTVTINEGRRGDTVSLLANGDQAIARAGQVDTVRGVADVQFLDGREVFDPNDPAAQVLRMYQAAFGRVPDQAGLHGWIGALEQGTPLSSVASAFLGTPEFAARYGTGLSTTAFVTALYQNALGRAPDAAGLASWVAQINSGQASQAQVLMDFSESAENRANTAGQVAAGIWDVSETGAEVARMYDTAFGRLPDVGGFSGWVAALNGGASLQALANGFVTSPEFTNTYGALDNAGFVQALYQNTLHRAGDAAGLAGWTNALAGGASRAQVVVGFSESAEHKANTAPNIISSDPSQYGIKLA